MSSTLDTFRKKATSPFFRIFLLTKLPLAYFAGVRITELTDDFSSTSIKFRWINQNPFRSVYFAALEMGAELASGILFFQFRESGMINFSMLLVKNEAHYHKKATGKITFKCLHGQDVKNAITALENTEDHIETPLTVSALNSDNEVIAEFTFTWSIKKKPRA